jgi:DsbC/DsbD-like thiol-disulfide interchange protein
MVRHCLMIACSLAIAVGLMVEVGSAGGKLDPVKVEAAAGKSDSPDKQVVVVKVMIEKGWHIYANPPESEEVEPAQTTVTIKAAGKPVKAKVTYPAGKLYKETGMAPCKVYEDGVTIQAELPKTEGALEVSVRFQACDNKRCLLPKTVKINLP